MAKDTARLTERLTIGIQRAEKTDLEKLKNNLIDNGLLVIEVENFRNIVRIMGAAIRTEGMVSKDDLRKNAEIHVCLQSLEEIILRGGFVL